MYVYLLVCLKKGRLVLLTTRSPTTFTLVCRGGRPSLSCPCALPLLSHVQDLTPPIPTTRIPLSRTTPPRRPIQHNVVYLSCGGGVAPLCATHFLSPRISRRELTQKCLLLLHSRGLISPDLSSSTRLFRRNPATIIPVYSHTECFQFSATQR